MRLEILQIPGCPHAGLLEQRLEEALVGHTVPVERDHKVLEDVEMAAAVGMTGSPTLLVDGVDPFAEPGLAPSISCRLYRGECGAQGAPSIAALRHALGATNSDSHNEKLGATPEEARDCCATGAGSSATTKESG